MKKILCLALVSVMMLACLMSASAAGTEGYVTDGLAAFYDAAQNTDATKWADLSGNGNDIVDLPNNDTNKFVDGKYLNTETIVNFPQGVIDVINEKDAWTTEIVLGSIEVSGTSWGTLLNSANDHYSLFYRVNDKALVLKNVGSAENERPLTILENGFADLANKTITVTFEKGVATRIYIDGKEVASAAEPQLQLTIDNFYFGHNDASKSHTTEYKAMRFYNRALTAEEVAQNAAADKPAGSGDGQGSSTTNPPATGDATMVFALIALVSVAGVVVVKRKAR